MMIRQIRFKYDGLNVATFSFQVNSLSAVP